MVLPGDLVNVEHGSRLFYDVNDAIGSGPAYPPVRFVIEPTTAIAVAKRSGGRGGYIVFIVTTDQRMAWVQERHLDVL